MTKAHHRRGVPYLRMVGISRFRRNCLLAIPPPQLSSLVAALGELVLSDWTCVVPRGVVLRLSAVVGLSPANANKKMNVKRNEKYLGGGPTNPTNRYKSIPHLQVGHVGIYCCSVDPSSNRSTTTTPCFKRSISKGRIAYQQSVSSHSSSLYHNIMTTTVSLIISPDVEQHVFLF